MSLEILNKVVEDLITSSKDAAVQAFNLGLLDSVKVDWNDAATSSALRKRVALGSYDITEEELADAGFSDILFMCGFNLLMGARKPVNAVVLKELQKRCNELMAQYHADGEVKPINALLSLAYPSRHQNVSTDVTRILAPLLFVCSKSIWTSFQKLKHFFTEDTLTKISSNRRVSSLKSTILKKKQGKKPKVQDKLISDIQANCAYLVSGFQLEKLKESRWLAAKKFWFKACPAVQLLMLRLPPHYIAGHESALKKLFPPVYRESSRLFLEDLKGLGIDFLDADVSNMSLEDLSTVIVAASKNVVTCNFHMDLNSVDSLLVAHSLSGVKDSTLPLLLYVWRALLIAESIETLQDKNSLSVDLQGGAGDQIDFIVSSINEIEDFIKFVESLRGKKTDGAISAIVHVWFKKLDRENNSDTFTFCFNQVKKSRK